MNKADEKWLKIPEEIRKKLLNNVWCSECLDAVKIVDYILKSEEFGILLEGKCNTCGGEVARLIENS